MAGGRYPAGVTGKSSISAAKALIACRASASRMCSFGAWMRLPL
jgi:hypothetical protein